MTGQPCVNGSCRRGSCIDERNEEIRINRLFTKRQPHIEAYRLKIDAAARAKREQEEAAQLAVEAEIKRVKDNEDARRYREKHSQRVAELKEKIERLRAHRLNLKTMGAISPDTTHEHNPTPHVAH